eukprot:PhM_4_TR11460/c0_g1_i1/m.67389
MDVLGPVDCPRYVPEWDDDGASSTDSYASLNYFNKRKPPRRGSASEKENEPTIEVQPKPLLKKALSRAGPRLAMHRTRTAVQGVLTAMRAAEGSPSAKFSTLTTPTRPLSTIAATPTAPCGPQRSETPVRAPSVSDASPNRPSAKVLVPTMQRMTSALRCASPNLKSTIQASKAVCRAVRSLTPKVFLKSSNSLTDK